jgi:hypothetical protein
MTLNKIQKLAGQVSVELYNGTQINLFDVRVFEAMRENDSVLFVTIPAEYHDNGRMFKGAYSVKIRWYSVL